MNSSRAEIISIAQDSGTAKIHVSSRLFLFMNSLMPIIEVHAVRTPELARQYLIYRGSFFFVSGIVYLITNRERKYITDFGATVYLAIYMMIHTMVMSNVLSAYYAVWNMFVIFSIVSSKGPREWLVYLLTSVLESAYQHFFIFKNGATLATVNVWEMHSRMLNCILYIAIILAYTKKRTKEVNLLQNNLIENSKMAALGRLSAGLAHEINNPLTIIKFILQNMNEENKPASIPSKFYEDLNKIEKHLLRLENIVTSFRSYSRLESNTDLEKRITLSAVIKEIEILSNPLIKKHEINLTTYFSPNTENLQFIGIPGKLEQVLTNLISNAIDALGSVQGRKGEARIIVSIVQDLSKSLILLSIEDNGPGIAEGIQRKIFDPFFTTKEQGKGTGLGLSISQSLVRDLRGKIVYENANPGARFVIELPIVNPA